MTATICRCNQFLVCLVHVAMWVPCPSWLLERGKSRGLWDNCACRQSGVARGRERDNGGVGDRRAIKKKNGQHYGTVTDLRDLSTSVLTQAHNWTARQTNLISPPSFLSPHFPSAVPAPRTSDSSASKLIQGEHRRICAHENSNSCHMHTQAHTHTHTSRDCNRFRGRGLDSRNCTHHNQTNNCPHRLTGLVARSLTHILTPSQTHSLITHLFIRSFTHSFTLTNSSRVVDCSND